MLFRGGQITVQKEEEKGQRPLGRESVSPKT
jgi:hypothetical protein